MSETLITPTLMQSYCTVWVARQARFGVQPQRVLAQLQNVDDSMITMGALNPKAIIARVDAANAEEAKSSKSRDALHRRLDMIEAKFEEVPAAPVDIGAQVVKALLAEGVIRPLATEEVYSVK